MRVPPVNARTLAYAAMIGAAIYIVMLLLPGGQLHPEPRWNCADHGYIACCFSD